MKKRARPDPQAPEHDRRPRPLIIGEHVLCALNADAPHPRLDALVVALDPSYEAAARHYEQQHQPTPPSPSPSPPSPPTPLDLHDLTAERAAPHAPATPPAAVHLTAVIDLIGDDAAAPAQPMAPIVFREAEHPARKPSTPVSPPVRTKRRRTELPLPPALEAYMEGAHIRPAAEPAPHPIGVGRVYVHFSGRDRRLDRWANAAELDRASASCVAAAASGVVENVLVDDVVNADFAVADQTATNGRKLTRSRRRAYEQSNPVSEREVGNEAAARMEREREESTKVRNISSIVFGDYNVDAWYFSPYPAAYGSVDTLYICGFCLKYVRTKRRYVKHCSTCSWRGPPGTLVYDDSNHSVCVYEVDGHVNPAFCERLCLLGKLFLDHKTLYFDVAPFYFYIVTLKGELAGFFSKEKPHIESEYNLACILTLPQHQRKGVGRFLISLSYELTKKEHKTGGPERPLSDLGQLSYRSYWLYAIVQFLRTCRSAPSVSSKDVSEATGIRAADVVTTLKSVNLVTIWKGETYADTTKDFEQIEQRISKPRLPLRPSLLRVDTSYRKPANSNSAPTRSPAVAATARKRQKKRLDKATPAATSTPTLAPTNVSSDSFPGYFSNVFSKFEINKMAKFIRKHTPEVVAGPMNTPGGMSSQALWKLAKELDMPLERCRKKLKRMASGLAGDASGDCVRYSHAPRMADLARAALQGSSYARDDSESAEAIERGHNGTRASLPLSVNNDLELVEHSHAHNRAIPRIARKGRAPQPRPPPEVVDLDNSPSPHE